MGGGIEEGIETMPSNKGETSPLPAEADEVASPGRVSKRRGVVVLASLVVLGLCAAPMGVGVAIGRSSGTRSRALARTTTATDSGATTLMTNGAKKRRGTGSQPRTRRANENASLYGKSAKAGVSCWFSFDFRSPPFPDVDL